MATDYGLARISREDADALGAEPVENSPETTGLDENATLEERVWDTLKCIYDPEIPVDIVDLGLIYDVTVTELENGLHHVAVKMTLTAPGCGMGPHLVMEAKDRIEALEGVEAADVDMVWDPPGTREMVSEEGKNETRTDLTPCR
ncbi:MAG: iron-sulfur cluster assembly protein [Akkermansia sp.]